MLVQDLFENRMHDAYSVFQQLAGAVHNSEDIDLRVGHELMPLQSWQARHLLGQYKSIAKRQGPDAAMRFLADYNAITAALDAMDTRLGQMKNMRGSLPGQRAVDETHNHDEPEECYTCRGTGEGQFDGTSCSACGGSGIVRPTRDDDDFDIPDDYDMREAAPDPKHLQRYGHELDQRFPDISNSVADRGVTVPNSKEVAGQTAHPNKHFQSTPFHTNGAKLATVVRPGTTPPRVKRLDTPTTVPNFLKKSMAQEDARPGPLERSAPHTQKKTTDQLTHLQALNGLEETVSLMRAANRRISENLSIMSEAGSPAQQAAIAIAMKKAGKKPKNKGVAEEKVRLDPKCWTGKHKEGTKIKGGVRVNNCVPNEGVAEATGDEKFDTIMGRMQREPTIPDPQMPPTDVKDLYQWAVKNNKPYHKIFAKWANREGYKSVAPALMKAGNLDTDSLDYWTPMAWKAWHGDDSEMPHHWSKERVPDELRDYLETVFDAYENIWQDWPTEYRQIGEQGVAEDFKQPMKMADYVAQADRLHDEMMRCQHANDEAGYERAKQQYLALERQARQGMVPETAGTTAATMPPSPAAAAQAKAIVQKAADDRAVSLANMARVVPNNVAEDSGAWPFQEINELSNDKLAQYKSAAGRAATAADRAGNYELGNKRFRGITQATKKQFANDVKKHRPQ